MKVYVVMKSLKSWDWDKGYDNRLCKVFDTPEKVDDFLAKADSSFYYTIIETEVE